MPTHNFKISVRKKIYSLFGFEEVPFNNDERLKELCACAMHKRNQKNKTNDKIVVRSYEEILKQMKDINRGFVHPTISYYLFNFEPEFPGAQCKFDLDTCTILIGLRMKSDTKMVHDVYVGIINEQHLFEFQGIIKDVDVEVSAEVSSSS